MNPDNFVVAAGGLGRRVRAAGENALCCRAGNGEGCRGIACVLVEGLGSDSAAEEGRKGRSIEDVEVDT